VTFYPSVVGVESGLGQVLFDIIEQQIKSMFDTKLKDERTRSVPLLRLFKSSVILCVWEGYIQGAYSYSRSVPVRY